MRTIEFTIGRQEAEGLVDLLEKDCPPDPWYEYRRELAAKLRKMFGMTTFEQEQEIRARLNK